MKKEIVDFGEKIVGARKDLYESLEKEKIEKSSATKGKIWPFPTGNKLVEYVNDHYQGDDVAAFYEYFVRNMIRPYREVSRYHRDMERTEYANRIAVLRDSIQSLPAKWWEDDGYAQSSTLIAELIAPLVKSSYYLPFVRLERMDALLLGAKLEGMNLTGEDKIRQYINTRYQLAVVGEGGDEGFQPSDNFFVRKKIPHGFITVADRSRQPLFKGDLIMYSMSLNRFGEIECCDTCYVEKMSSREEFEARKEQMIQKKLDTNDSTAGAAKKTNRKQAFHKPVPELNKVRRNAKTHILGKSDELGIEQFERDVRDHDWLDVFGFRGVQFGNWTNQSYRQLSLNMAFEAFDDLARTLGISRRDVTLGGDLSLAFGARGRAAAAAHFEPVMNIINLTKKHGAGSLAHEWGHALDCYLADVAGIERLDALASSYLFQIRKGKQLPEAVLDLFDQIFYHSPEYYKGSLAFGRAFRKMGIGYWESKEERFARAFSCYVIDKLSANGEVSDYLVYQTDKAYTIPDTGECAFPLGEERKAINQAFDQAFKALLDAGVFTPYEEFDAKSYFKAAKPKTKATAKVAAKAPNPVVYTPPKVETSVVINGIRCQQIGFFN